MPIETLPALRPTRAPWNKGRIVGQKRPLLPKHVWSIRVRLEMADKSWKKAAERLEVAYLTLADLDTRQNDALAAQLAAIRKLRGK